jgi:hypothetical protein
MNHHFSKIKNIVLFKGLAVVLAVLSGGIFVYAVNNSALRTVKREFFVLNTQIKEITSTMEAFDGMEKGIIALKEKSVRLHEKFPDQAQDSLAALSNFARRLNIDVVSMEPAGKSDFLYNGKQLLVDGRICQVVRVNLNLKCGFRQLVRYLEGLNNAVPAFICTEKILLRKEGEILPRLNVELNLDLYLLT